MITCVIGRYEQKNIAIHVSTEKIDNVNKNEGKAMAIGPFLRHIDEGMLKSQGTDNTETPRTASTVETSTSARHVV